MGHFRMITERLGSPVGVFNGGGGGGGTLDVANLPRDGERCSLLGSGVRPFERHKSIWSVAIP